jgi:hypothetical protein
MRKSTEKLLGFIFGTSFVAVMLVIAFLAPYPTKFQYEVFKIVLALAGAGCAAVMPGFIKVEYVDIKYLPAIRAGGALAVFLILFFNSPAGLLLRQPPIKSHEGFLSVLQKHFQDRVSVSEYSLRVQPRSDVDVGRFWIDPVSDDSWTGLFKKVCAKYPCMKCNVENLSTEIQFAGKLVAGRTPEGAAKYSCW